MLRREAVELLSSVGLSRELTLNIDFVRKQLRPLAELKEAPEILDELERCRLENEQ